MLPGCVMMLRPHISSNKGLYMAGHVKRLARSLSAAAIAGRISLESGQQRIIHETAYQ